MGQHADFIILGSAYVAFVCAVFFIRGSKKTKNANKEATTKLTEMVLDELGVRQSAADPLNVNLFMNAYRRHLNVVYPKFGSRRSFYGKTGFAKVNRLDLMEITEDFTEIYFKFLSRDKNRELFEGSNYYKIPDYFYLKQGVAAFFFPGDSTLVKRSNEINDDLEQYYVSLGRKARQVKK